MALKLPSSKPRICILTCVHQPFDPRIFHKEARSLADAGYEVIVVAPHGPDENVDGIRVKGVPQPKSRIARMLITSWRVWRAGVSERADVYHFHDPELLIAGLLLKMLGHRVIYDAHEDFPKTFSNKHYIPRLCRGWMARAANLIEKGIARSLDAVVPATDDIAKNFGHCRRVAIVRNYPRSSGLEEIPEPWPRDGIFRCAYVGSLSEARGVSKIVQALSELGDDENIELVLCGIFSPSVYEKEVRGLPGFARTQHLGWMDPSAVPVFLSTVDVGLVCIQPEAQYLTSLPTKLFEYMVAGLPVIASNFPLWREIVEGQRCGLCVDPREPRELAEAIRYLHAHSDVRAEMGKNGRTAALSEFNWESQSKVLIDLYAEILGNKTLSLPAKQTVARAKSN
jgi:glycosyltransferase involved in cell wall biosynthesis